MTKNIVDIIIVTYNRIEYLKMSVEMLELSTSYPYRIIVVDNGSADGTREWLIEQKEKGIIGEYVFNKENMKMAAAFTEGFKHVTSDLFITVADDMIPPMNIKADWLEVFVTKINSDNNIGCINFVGTRQDFNEFKRKEYAKLSKRH
jgi:GT2 family glycosyltransferase